MRTHAQYAPSRKLRQILLTLGLVCSMILPAAPLARAQGPASTAQETGGRLQESQESKGNAAGVVFRTHITVRTSAHWQRLADLGLLILDQGDDWAVVLADDEQLESLARLRFEPQASDELSALLAAQGPERAWLQTSLQPLLDQGRALQAPQADKTAAGEAAQTARTSLRAAMASLTAEQRAGLAASSSLDDDGDGLTNTEEAWWCTDPMNPNSDGDAQGYTDGQEVEALLDVTVPRAVRWGYGPPFGPPNPWPNFNDRNGTHVAICNDGDFDTIPDYAEVYMVGTRVPYETTDNDKFDDGQELFGVTFCPGAPTNCGYGSYPAIEYWNFIKATMPNWVLPPGDSPLVAAFPVPEVHVTPGSWHVERVTTITTSQGQMTQTEHSYETSVTRGESSSIADTVTWNDWEEVSEAVERPLNNVRDLSLDGSPRVAVSLRRDYAEIKVITGAGLTGLGLIASAGCVILTGGGCALPILVGGVVASAGASWGLSGLDDLVNLKADEIQPQQKYDSSSCEQQHRFDHGETVCDQQYRFDYDKTHFVTVNQSLDAQGIASSLDGISYAISQQSALFSGGLQDVSFAISRPRFTETRTNGRSWGGAQTTTHEVYEEHTISEGQAFTTGENWSTAWAIDSSHAADLTFTYTIKNTGTEYAREIGGLIFNIYLGDDTEPTITYPAWQQFPNGKLENLFPVGPNTPPGVGSERTFTSTDIPLSLEQMKRIDLGERLTIKVESYSYGADELFYTDAVNGGVTVFVEDGVEDGDETVDMYVIPTWGAESVQDVLTRYFPHGEDADGNLNALWTPEFDGINPPTWNEHYLSDIAWWNVYLTQPDAGDTPLHELPAQAGSGILFRFNRDSDRDGYNDRAEFRYYCSLPDSTPDHIYCADGHLRPEIHPQPEVLAGFVTRTQGDVVTALLVLENTGTFDAYGIDAVMYSPDDTTTIGNNTVGGNGQVRPGRRVVVGSMIKKPNLGSWGSSTSKPYAAGNYSGDADRTYTFSAQTPGVVGQSGTAVAWNDGAGDSGTIDLGTAYHAPLPVDVADGLKVGFNTGTVAVGARFTVQALTPRDTFTYTVNSPTYTPPVIAVSYSDPQGSHRFVTPVELPSLDADLAPYAGQMLSPIGLQIATTGEVVTSGDNTTHLIVDSPHPATIQDGHLYVDFVSDGVRVAHQEHTLDIPAGPTVSPVVWATSAFMQTYDPAADNILLAFWTDSEGNIIDSAARPFSTFQQDPTAEAAVPMITWDVGTLRWPESFNTLSTLLGSSHTPGVVKQSGSYRLLGSAGQPAASPTLSSANYRLASGYWAAVRSLQQPSAAAGPRSPLLDNDSPERFPAHSFPIGNTGWQTLRLGPGSPPADVSVTQVPSQTVQPGQHTTLDVQLATGNLGIGPFERVVPLRSNDPNLPEVQLRIVGTVEPASDVVFVYDYQSEVRPLTKVAHVNSVRSAGDLVSFAHGIGGDASALQPLILYAGDGSTQLGRGAALQPASPVLAQTAGNAGSTDLTLTDSTSVRRDYVVSYGYQAVLPAGGGQTTFEPTLPRQYYDAVNADVLVHNPAQSPLSLALDVGADGSVEWTFDGPVASGDRLPASGLAGAINAYLAGQSGAEATVPMRLTSNTAGTYFLTNLRATRSTNYDLAFAGNVSVSNPTPMETDVVQVCATLVNQGQGVLPAAMASFFSDNPSAGGYLLGHSFVSDLAAEGGARQACIDWDTTGFTGPLTLHARADHWNLVAETNKTNNTATAAVTVLTRPDLAVTEIALSDEEPAAGQAISLQATVRNAGQSNAGSQQVAFYLGNPADGGALLGSQAIASLAGGAETTVAIPWTPDQPGPVRLFAIADHGGAIAESDEGNNQLWIDRYAGFAGPLLMDSGSAVADPPYTTEAGYGAVDQGQPDVLVSCGPGTAPEDTLRRDPDGQVIYRFDHLLPGHFYHLDIILRECDGVGRQESILVDGNLIEGPIDLADGQPHYLSRLLDPALYANRTISVTVEAPGADGAVVSQVSLFDIDYRYADAGGSRDPQYPDANGYGWLDGVANTAWGALPYQSVRIDQNDNQQRYRFDGLDPARQYQVNMTFYQSSGPGRQQVVEIDGLPSGLSVDTGDYVVHRLTATVPLAAYVGDGSIVVSAVRTDAGTGAMVNEISLEQKTLLTLPGIHDVRVSNVADTSATISWLTNQPAGGAAFFGTTPALGQVAQDVRGANVSSRTHVARLTGLAPSTTYYFAVASADALDDNQGALYQFSTGPTLAPTAPDVIYGQVFLPDGVTPATGAIVYVTARDANGQGSPGAAAPLAHLITASDGGYWNVDLARSRTANQQQTFQYSPAGDQVHLLATDGSECSAEQVVDTANDAPAPAMNLSCPTQVTHSLAVGWNLLGLNVLSDPQPTAEQALDDIEAQGGNATEINRWLNGGWDAHIHNLPFNDFPLELGKGYFVRAPLASAWQRSGRPPSNPVTLALTPGWNLVSFPKLTCPLSAEQVLDGIQAQGGNCTEIDQWLNGGWLGHIHNLPFNNFPIATDQGYFVRCTAASTYVPCQSMAERAAAPTAESMPAAALPAASDPLIGDVLVTNRRDVALTVAWRTDQPSDGWVEYGLTPDLGQAAYDERGREAVSTVHQVTLTGLAPETTYYLRVRSGNSTGDDGKPIQVTTAPTTPPATPFLAYGQVLNGDGSPAAGALVVVRLGADQDQRNEPFSALVDSAGYWALSLPLDACEAASLALEVIRPDGSRGSLDVPACAAQPAPVVQFKD